MTKSGVLVVTCTVLAMAGASLRVPVRGWTQFVPTNPHAEAARMTIAEQAAGAGPEDLIGVEKKAMDEGEAQPTQSLWPPTYRWVWEKRFYWSEEGPFTDEWRVSWGILVAEQALILLLGGSLLSLLVRWERRRRADDG